jgi:hypothetical protein
VTLSRLRRLTALALAGAALAGCANQPVASLSAPSGPAPTTAAPTKAVSAPADSPRAPLTGLPVSAAVARRPAVVVPVPVLGAVGLDKADVVFQEYETPTAPRAVALFQSRDATAIGPVGQVRSMDPQLLPALHPVYVNAGGGSGVTDLLTKAGVKQVPASGTTSTAAGLATAQLRTAAKLTVTVPGGSTETWTYTGGKWTRPGVAVTNLVVQTVEYKAVTLKNPPRSVQSARVLNRGSCYAFSAANYTPCGWYKRAADSPSSYSDTAGVALRFTPGPTWVLLVPPGSQVAAT